MSQADLTTAYRKANQAIRANTLRDFLRLWGALDLKQLERSYPAWERAVTTLVERDRVVASQAAAMYLRASKVESGVAGAPAIRLAEAAPRAQISAALSSTARAGYYTALTYYPEVQAERVALVRATGAVGRLVLNAGRDTIRESLKRDHTGRGWQRVTSGAACNFCKLLAGRGAIYSADTAEFAAHDHCACTVQPKYSERAVPVLPYEPSSRGRFSVRGTDADRTRLRAAVKSVA